MKIYKKATNTNKNNKKATNTNDKTTKQND